MRSHKLVVSSVSILLSLTSVAVARTWYVAANGSGDAPTVDAAVDSTVSGDVIVVGPGNFPVGSMETGSVILKPHTILVSEFGPTTTVLYPAGGALQSGVISAFDNCAVRSLTVEGGQDAAVFCGGSNIEVFNNIIHGRLQVLGPTSVHHNLVNLPGAQSQAVLIGYGATVQLFNNIILGEVAFHEPNCAFGVTGYCNLIQEWPACFGISYANFSADPLFCGEGNYYLRADSPCAPGAIHDGIDCGIIGPLPVACGTVRVELKSWGAVKALYKN